MNSSDIQDDGRQVLFTQCDFAGGVCKQIVPAIFAEPRCHLHTKLQPVVYRYTGCEQDVRCFCVTLRKHLTLCTHPVLEPACTDDLPWSVSFAVLYSISEVIFAMLFFYVLCSYIHN